MGPSLSWAQVAPVSVSVRFEQICSHCHDNPNAETPGPTREALRSFPTERVLEAITNGPMAIHAANLSADEKRALAELVTGKPLGGGADRTAAAMKNRCATSLSLENPWGRPRWNGWSPDPTTEARFQPAAAAGLTADQIPRLKLKWAFAFPGAGAGAWGQPAVVAGAVFVASDNNFVYALDAKTGCVHWSYGAKGPVRTAITIGEVKGQPGVRYAAYFGDVRGNVYAVDAERGQELWFVHVEDHPGARITGSPVLDAASGRLYVPVASWEEVPGVSLTYPCCTFQGSITALDARTGKQIWKTYTLPERPVAFKKNSIGVQLYGPAGASIWNAPTLDLKRHALYVGTGNRYIDFPESGAANAIMAFDLDTGKRLWWTQLRHDDVYGGGCGTTPQERRINCPGFIPGPNDDVYGSPILHTLPNGRRMIIAGQETGLVNALDPDDRGRVLWVAQAGDAQAAANSSFGGAFDGERYYRPLAFRDQTGAIAAVNVMTGERVWYTTLPKPANCQDPSSTRECHSGNWGPATAIPGVVFAGSHDGILRAYSSADGKIIWEFPTRRAFETVNGVPGHGGAIGGTAPTIADGMLFMGSGYSVAGGSEGNVLLAFGLE